MAEAFDVDAFLANMEKDRSKQQDPSDRLNKVVMSSQTNQGTVTFIPVFSKAYNNFYLKLPGVREFSGDTTMTKSGVGWFKLLPMDAYGELTPSELELYNEVSDLYDEITNNYEVDYTEFRTRTYSMFTGIQVGHVNSSGERLDDYNDSMCLYVFPSNSPINAFLDAVNAKLEVTKGNRAWLVALLSRENTNKQGVIQITFKKSTGAGYDSSVAFEFNNALNPIVDPTKVYEDDFLTLADSAMEQFIAWGYDHGNNKLFSSQYMREFRDDLKLRLQDLKKADQAEQAKEAQDAAKAANPNMASENQQAPTAPMQGGTGVTNPPF